MCIRDRFILSGYPNLEEAYWFGENVTPLLRARGLLGDTSANPTPDDATTGTENQRAAS